MFGGGAAADKDEDKDQLPLRWPSMLQDAVLAKKYLLSPPVHADATLLQDRAFLKPSELAPECWPVLGAYAGGRKEEEDAAFEAFRKQAR